MLDKIEYVTPVQKLNLSFLLASMARYNLSLKILSNIEYNRLLPREQGYYWLQSFFLQERLEKKTNFEIEFMEIKKILLTNIYTPSAETVFISQAIAFKVKSNIISDELLDFFVNRGVKNVEILLNMDTHDFNRNLSLSNFYRSYAMLFMKDNIPKVLSLMEKCKKYADLITPVNRIEELKKLEALKTYHESSLKAEVYLTKDYKKALYHGFEMLKIDPNWSIFKSEVGLIYEKKMEFEKAITWLKDATKFESPLYLLNLYNLANIYERKDRLLSQEIYLKILEIDPLNYSSAIRGHIISKNNRENNIFNNKLDYFIKEGYVTRKQVEDDVNNG
ncbi:tetratricopeptide repeat protein [Macrococcus armenti]|uniref:tetratricopeptide repeat protein n=1 Tax=Macrococcus armenti TaxID=2875764 RepID=UPI001CCC5D4D|nr:hypothetical protein [Macrococcus armenti]UBH16591.1 hypothetical protein LAU44_12135 [Macrococcus armenti]UBH21226.1 hypothetical protein LAU40_12170 [Macrococcus armenti]